MDFRQTFVDFASGKKKSKRGIKEEPKESETPKEKKVSKATTIPCPQCSGTGIEPGTDDLRCHFCHGRGKIKKRDMKKKLDGSD